MRLTERYPLLFPIYAPVLLVSIATAMLIPVLPLYVADFGVSYAVVGIVLAANGIGTMIGDVPAGILLRRVSIKAAMATGLLLYGSMTLLLFWIGAVGLVIVTQMIGGIGMALFIVSWHAYIADTVDVTGRGRVSAFMGGIFRLSTFIGPVIGGTLAARVDLRAPFLLAGLVAFSGIAFVLVFTRAERSSLPHGSAGLGHLAGGLLAIFRAHAGILTVAGTGQMLTAVVRNGRNTILPLYGADVLGLDAGQIGLLASLTWGADLLLFPSAGWLMDRWGRKYAIVPSLAIQGAAMALIPLTGSFTALAAVSVLIGLGNGMSAGTMLALGADLAPDEGRGDFLGLWHMIGDLGFAGGPFVVGMVAAVLTLPAAALALAGAGCGAALVFGRFVPETLKRADRVLAVPAGK